MNSKEKSDLFWKEYLKLHPEAGEIYDVWSFGDNPRLAYELLELVRQGVKTGTASSYDLYEMRGETVPFLGGYSVILDEKGDPKVIVVTTKLQILPFDEVGAEFAYTEGEDDRTLESWRHEHELYFTREWNAINKPFNPKMKVVCENFKVVYMKS
ncbi:MAG: ASCH domain-containing protein [Paenibacillus sp.]|nr:ASCH domain-containing protein [Paenibacillus sp.]